jgi:superfamily II DNA or RNA helicase
MAFLSRESTSPKLAFEETDAYQRQLSDLNIAGQARFGHSPRPWQSRAALALHHKHNVMLISGTGSGKSMAYQALCLLRDGVVLVIAPLNQLMEQQAESLRAKGITSIALTAAQLDEPGVHGKLIAGEYKVIFASPERTLAQEGPLWELITKSDQSFLKRLMYVVIDEAHLVFDWGQSFRPQYANIPALRPYLRKCDIPIIAMTATASTDKVRRLSQVLEFDSDRSILIRETTNRPNIYYAVKGITAGEAKTFVRYLYILPCIGAYTDFRKIYCGWFSPIGLPLWKYLSVLCTQIPRWTASLSPRNFDNYSRITTTRNLPDHTKSVRMSGRKLSVLLPFSIQPWTQQRKT